MRHLFIINPAAGKKDSTAALEKQIAALSFDHNIAYTLAEGDARRITEEAVSLGEPMRIYACGGDGTLNEVVNGAAGHDHVATRCQSVWGTNASPSSSGKFSSVIRAVNPASTFR